MFTLFSHIHCGNACLVINDCIFLSFHPAGSLVLSPDELDEGLVMNAGGDPAEQWAKQQVDLVTGP